MNMPKVSVIISTYNRPEKLKRAIESVLAQSYQDFEVIVVNDGELLDTYDLACEVTDNRVRWFGIEHFGNDTKPKNKGILEAKGDYIAFCDDDNIFRKDHLAILVKELEANPKLDVAYGDRWVIDEDNKQQPRIGTYSDYQTGLLFQQNYIDTSDVLVRREALFKVGGFDEGQKKYIDWNLWVRMEKAGMKFKRVPTIITDYYIHSDSKSNKVLTENEKKYQEVTGEFRNIPDWDPVDCTVELPYLGEKKEPRIAIFSLTYDRLEYTKACFESMYKTAGYPFDHLVIDNGSTDGTKEWLEKWKKEQPGRRVLHKSENTGISIASNDAVEEITSSLTIGTKSEGEAFGVEVRTGSEKTYNIVVKVDNDCFFLTQDWLKKMVEIWKSNHRIALSPYVEGLRDNPGGAPRYNRGQVRGEILGMTKHLGGICHFVDASAYKDFRWDEHSQLHGAQDLEFSQYLEQKGFAMGYLENIYIEHFKGTATQHLDYPEYFKRREWEKTHRYGDKKDE